MMVERNENEVDCEIRREAEPVDDNGAPKEWDWQWWATASAVQLGWGVLSCARGYTGSHQLMPLKAFAVAGLFVGSGTAASIAGIRAYGIKSVEDAIQVGSDIRHRIITPQLNGTTEKSEDQ